MTKTALSVSFWSSISRNNVFNSQEHNNIAKFGYTFYQFRKPKQIISIKATAFMIKIKCLEFLEGRK